MNGRTFAWVLLAVVIITGGVFLGIGAYNAGVTQGLIESGQISSPGPYIGGPYAGLGHGYGYGPGFGFFGFLATLFFIFIVIALVRAAFGWGRGYGPGRGRWGGPGGWDRAGHGPWDDRAREIHDEWHRAHGGSPSGDGGADAAPRA
jgi:hypothetical protein